MKTTLALAASLARGLFASAGAAEAKGCIKGALGRLSF